jgi:2-dehydro-3-deoxygalactonokinase
VSAWLACDWGTTNVRAWRIEAGRAVASASFPFGVSKIGRGDVPLRLEQDIRPALKAEGLPVLLSGMAGSNLGWMAAPYVDCPADAKAVAKGLVQPAERVWIVPGVRTLGQAHGPDVMRGEEVQIFGALASTVQTGLFCLPGTHAKWVRVEGGKITDFVTAMTGELYALLSQHSILATVEDPAESEGFAAGLAASGEGDALSARLFGLRARQLTGSLAEGQSAGFLSGLLIGSDVASSPRLLGASEDEPITLIGDPALSAAYGQALAARGRSHQTIDGEAAALAGLISIIEGIAL